MIRYNPATYKGISEMVLYWTKQCIVEYVPFEIYAYHYCKANYPTIESPYPISVTETMMSIFVDGTPNTAKYIKEHKKEWESVGSIKRGLTNFEYLSK